MNFFIKSVFSRKNIFTQTFAALAILFLSVPCCFVHAAEINGANNKARLVSLMPSYTEILFALGASNEIVGVSNFCDYPSKAKEITKVGDYYSASAEKIYSLKPTIVFLPLSSVYKLGDDLEKLKIDIVRIPQEKNIEDIFSTIEIISKKIGKVQNGKKLIKSLRAKIPAKKQAERKKVYIDIDTSLWTCGNSSFLSDIVYKAGGINVFASVKKNYFQASWEEIIKAKPDCILSISGNSEDLTKKTLSNKIPAIGNNELFLADRDILTRPSPRLFDVLEDISRFIQKCSQNNLKK